MFRGNRVGNGWAGRRAWGRNWAADEFILDDGVDQAANDDNDENWGHHLGRRGLFGFRRNNAPAQRQRNIVFVQFPIAHGVDESDAFPRDERMIINRETLFQYLPRTEYLVRRGQLHLDLLFPPAMVHPDPLPFMGYSALHEIFRHVQGVTRGRQINMFANARLQIDTEPNRMLPLRAWAYRVHEICDLLNIDGGLGCGDDMLRDILGFTEYIFMDVHNYGGYDEASMLLESISAVFHPRPQAVETLRRIWNTADAQFREQATREMRAAEDNHPGARRLLTALQAIPGRRNRDREARVGVAAAAAALDDLYPAW